MNMIFPGMDPYLEDPLIWPGVHTSLIVYIRHQLQPLLRPRYNASIEERVFIQGPDRHIVPDLGVRRVRSFSKAQTGTLAEADTPVVVRAPELEIHEAYLNIVDLKSGRDIVTVIEVVSPTNKYSGPGRDAYVTKQREIRKSRANLVEIDLHRTGPHVVAVPEILARAEANYDYLACVNRSKETREEFDLYPRSLRQRLPRLRVPLRGDDPDVVLDLQRALGQAYADGDYDVVIDYFAPCKPPLSPEDQAWANQLIAQAQQTSA